jgi:hypothetical protein
VRPCCPGRCSRHIPASLVSLLYATAGQAGGTAFLAVIAFAPFQRVRVENQKFRANVRDGWHGYRTNALVTSDYEPPKRNQCSLRTLHGNDANPVDPKQTPGWQTALLVAAGLEAALYPPSPVAGDCSDRVPGPPTKEWSYNCQVTEIIRLLTLASDKPARPRWGRSSAPSRSHSGSAPVRC